MADVGQEGSDWGPVMDRAQAAGAVEAVVVDVREEFAEDFVAPALQANALYEGRYPLVSALSRPVIVKHLVEAANAARRRRRGPRLHRQGQRPGALRGRRLALRRPDLDVLAPVRTWGMTREDAILYAYRHDIPITATKEKLYSIDDNLWGRAIECGEMEDPWARPPPGVWSLTMATATEPRDLDDRLRGGRPRRSRRRGAGGWSSSSPS